MGIAVWHWRTLQTMSKEFEDTNANVATIFFDFLLPNLIRSLLPSIGEHIFLPSLGILYMFNKEYGKAS